MRRGGAFDAWRNRFRLLDADEAGLSDAYKALCDQYIREQSQHQAMPLAVAAE